VIENIGIWVIYRYKDVFKGFTALKEDI